MIDYPRKRWMNKNEMPGFDFTKKNYILTKHISLDRNI